MNAAEIYRNAVDSLNLGEITVGEFDAQIAVLKDVEPVVRCKDCKNWKKSWIEGVSRGMCIGGIPRKSLPYDFCSYGERRTDNG